MFHGTGLLIALLSIAIGSKLVLRRPFDPALLLADIATHHPTAVWPGPLGLFSDLHSRISLAFLERYPSPADARGLGEARLAGFLVL